MSTSTGRRRTIVAGVMGPVVALAVAVAADSRQPPPGAVNISATAFDHSRQMLLVVTGSWDEVAGTMRRFERTSSAAAWSEVGASVPVVVGRTGLAWGRGVRVGTGDGPVKKEGDGKAPAGAYRLGNAFGLAAQKPSRWSLPYLYLGDQIECVDDAASAQYNRLVARSRVTSVDWTSSERMWEQPLYKWGVIVEHNADPIQPAGGSCIFLHIWSGPARGTAGCTAMAEPDLVAIIDWLNPARSPLLVQLPRPEYERLKDAWRLP